jgi:hypothetical protein
MRILVLLALLSPTTVRAEPDADELLARGHFAKAVDLYNLRRYADAMQEFEAARAAKPLPAFEFNIARCEAHLGRKADAIASYQRYLTALVPPEEAVEVRARIAALEAPDQRRSIAPFVVGGAAVAALAGAAIAGAASQSIYNDLSGRCSPDGSCAPMWAPMIDRGRGAAIASDVMLGVGVAAAVVAVVLFIVDRRHNASQVMFP